MQENIWCNVKRKKKKENFMFTVLHWCKICTIMAKISRIHKKEAYFCDSLVIESNLLLFCWKGRLGCTHTPPTHTNQSKARGRRLNPTSKEKPLHPGLGGGLPGRCGPAALAGINTRLEIWWRRCSPELQQRRHPGGEPHQHHPKGRAEVTGDNPKVSEEGGSVWL